MRWSQPSRSRLEAALIAVALFGVGLFGVPAASQASPASMPPPISTGVVDRFTLYGNALSGWGFDANNTTNPGPHLSVSFGDTVEPTLIAADSATHTWFIDYDNSSAPNGAEPSSPQFSPGNSILWNFTASRIGTYVYRCQIHPSGMTGLITISAPTHYTLYGDASRGWGFNATNLTKPGPTLIVEKGVNVTLTLYSEDGTFHTWFIDFDNSSTVGSGETESRLFGGSGNPNPLSYNLTATRAGTFAYRCGIHLSTMWGMIIVLGTPSALPASFPIGLIPGIMVVVIVGVLLLAVVYQVRAARAARLKK
jgi:plastocyanin